MQQITPLNPNHDDQFERNGTIYQYDSDIRTWFKPGARPADSDLNARIDEVEEDVVRFKEEHTELLNEMIDNWLTGQNIDSDARIIIHEYAKTRINSLDSDIKELVEDWIEGRNLDSELVHKEINEIAKNSVRKFAEDDMPSTASAGDIWHDTDEDIVYVYTISDNGNTIWRRT
ncbi:MAG: hypothetical protein N0C84_00900 [Candidatus Thiodiazotropha taylori]|uniref:Uncharacterized protein n=1 Tax=Candidatus Thiodiazotropha taylori TaxID=2792791 RepID=A0A9E4K9I4_9GAMM|nr:hypothetical protein [Candidatus Thiodiazotropha taylori]MCW4255003.1 hypothetical protein [Candidatus Thiodiazotropha taylori]